MFLINESTPAQIDGAVQAAAAAFASFAVSSAAQRATLLCGLAEALEAQRATLVLLADKESGLGVARLSGELNRTTFQLRGFAVSRFRGASGARRRFCLCLGFLKVQ
jgi:NADP-dependent aldehyde dehydrogenase